MSEDDWLKKAAYELWDVAQFAGWNLKGDHELLTQRLRRLASGLPFEDEFVALLIWLGRCRLVYKLEQPSRQCRREGPRHDLRRGVSPARAAARTCPGHRGHHPPTLCRLIWKILHERVRYEERGPAVSAEAKKVRARKMIRELRSLGYRVELPPTPSSSPA